MPSIFFPKKHRLTIGMCVIQDYKSLWFTIQSILIYHPEVTDRIEFLIIDNDPETNEGRATKNFCERWVKKVPIRYIPFDEYRATSLRNKLFDHSNTEYVLVCDSHVLFPLGSIKSLIDYFDQGKDEGGLIHGPLLMDDLNNKITHMDPVFRDKMLGIWKTNDKINDPSINEIGIPGHGMGMFACRKSAWLRFPDENRGFGSEEIMTAKLFSAARKKVVCLKSLQWLHLFRYEGEKIPYPNTNEDRVKNYFRFYKKVGEDPKEMIEHFSSEGIPIEDILKWQSEV